MQLRAFFVVRLTHNIGSAVLIRKQERDGAEKGFCFPLLFTAKTKKEEEEEDR